MHHIHLCLVSGPIVYRPLELTSSRILVIILHCIFGPKVIIH